MASEEDNFKPAFKYYKRKVPKPNFVDVIDFQNTTNSDITKTLSSVPTHNCLGIKKVSEWECYQINKIPGLYFIPNPFTEDGKILWSKHCLENYSCQPHATNIGFQDESPWVQSCKIIKSTPESVLCNNEGQLNTLKSSPVWSLRWGTLGMHHDWNTSVYCETKCSKFPEELQKLSSLFASFIDWKDYKAEASIINFYHVGSTLSPHTDHSEKDLTCPLLSISFGLSAIFLIGGSMKSQAPQAILIRSGDVIIMSGTSRLAYHAIPRILECNIDNERTDPIEIFLAHSRINMNVRQYCS